MSTTGTGGAVLSASPSFITPTIDNGAASSLIITGAASSSGNYCLQTSTTGAVTNTGAACGSGNSGATGAPVRINTVVYGTGTTVWKTFLSMPAVAANTTATGRCAINALSTGDVIDWAAYIPYSYTSFVARQNFGVSQAYASAVAPTSSQSQIVLYSASGTAALNQYGGVDFSVSTASVPVIVNFQFRTAATNYATIDTRCSWISVVAH